MYVFSKESVFPSRTRKMCILLYANYSVLKVMDSCCFGKILEQILDLTKPGTVSGVEDKTRKRKHLLSTSSSTSIPFTAVSIKMISKKQVLKM